LARSRLMPSCPSLAVTIERTATVVAQARSRLAGQMPDGATRLVLSRIARRAGRTPRSVTADRGYGEPATERELQALGIRTVAIPRRAGPSAARRAVEHARGFRTLVKWRTGCEGRTSYLKRGYGRDRTRLDGRDGASIWCGHGVFSHNLVKISALAS
jgi:transposase, IS5 family